MFSKARFLTSLDKRASVRLAARAARPLAKS